MTYITTHQRQMLPEKHATLAESFGISREQITIVPNNSELRRVARAYGDSKEKTETTIGLCIRAEKGDTFADPHIVLVWPVPDCLHEYTYLRVDSHTRSNYADTTQKNWLLAFLLLHEIAHFKLGHRKDGDEEADERDADLWADARLTERYGA